MNNLFKLILIEEIKRKSLNLSIKDFYLSLDKDELEFQYLCADAALSRGSLPLIEKFLRSKNKEEAFIQAKIIELSDFNFYFSSEKIYNYIIRAIQDKNINFSESIDYLKQEAVCGKLDEIIKSD